MPVFPPISTDVIDLGRELFASADERVICWKGENYYRACGEVVFEYEDGAKSHCIKPVHHISWDHEDFDQHLKDRDFETRTMDDELRRKAHRILMQTGLESEQVYNALNALYYAKIGFRKGEL